MIYFITNHTEYYKQSIDLTLFSDITILNSKEGKKKYWELLGKKRVLAYDLEASGLDGYTTDILLTGIGTKQVQFMFDYTIDLKDIIQDIVTSGKTLIGTNLSYDIKLTYVSTGILIKKIFDIMIADQRLYMGSGQSWGYADIAERYLKKIILKGKREDFIGKNPEDFRMNVSHLQYLKGDLVDLFAIRKKQQERIKRFNMEFLIYGIEFPLVSSVALAELEGFHLNKEKWIKRYEEEIEQRHEILCKMDEEVLKLREQAKKEGKDVLPITGGKWDKERIHNSMYDVFHKDGSTDVLDLFGEPMSKKTLTGTKKAVTIYPNNINYNSNIQIITLFAVVGEPLLTKKEDYFIPKLDAKGKLTTSKNLFSLKAELIEKYIQEKKSSKVIPFLKLFTKYKKLEKSINTYGESFINNLNPVTSKLHTSFRQCFADTGRFQSGGGDKEPDKPNFQNIPKDKKYRHCFTVDTDKYSVCTADYSGAELIVMCSHAGDSRLLELSKGDMHSYMATKCWRAIYKSRADRLLKYIGKLAANPYGNTLSPKKQKDLEEKYKQYLKLSKEFEVSSEHTPDLRQDFKPMTFGTIYGMYAKKAGKTLNIPKEEGQIVIDVIKKEIPATFRMVEQASEFAKNRGYVILDHRTNARAWFPYLIKRLRGDISERTHFIDISQDLSSARNARIQGTQATFVKEAIVALDTYIQKNDIDARQISWVHDEIVTKTPRYLDGKSDEWHSFIKANPSGLSFNGKSGLSFPQVKEMIMTTTANKYLKGVEIKVDVQVEDYWTK